MLAETVVVSIDSDSKEEVLMRLSDYESFGVAGALKSEKHSLGGVPPPGLAPQAEFFGVLPVVFGHFKEGGG